MFWISTEALSNIADEILPLAKYHWEVVGHTGTSHGFDLNLEAYSVMERIGTHTMVVLRDTYGQVKGYASVILTPSLHSKGSYVSVVDAIVVNPIFARHNPTASKSLFKFTELVCKWAGAHYIQVSSGTNYPIGNYLKRRHNYVESETVFVKEL